MKKLLLLMLVLSNLYAVAQPTIHSAIIPQAGDSLHYVRAADTDPQDALQGANQNWDFSGLAAHPTNPEFYFKFLLPGDTPHGSRYPSAFLAATSPDTSFAFYVFDGTTLELTGAASEVPMFGTAFQDYQNNETETIFPMQYESSWSDDFNGVNSAGGFSTNFTGTVSGEADGYGTLILPTGTFANVVRTKEVRSYQVAGAPFAQNSTLWRYASAENKLWLLSIEAFDNGGEQLVYYADSPELVSHTNEAKSALQISIFPNPLRSGQTLHIQNETGQISALVLTDFSGREVYIQSAPDIGQFDLPVNLQPGIYCLSVSNPEIHFVQKIIVLE